MKKEENESRWVSYSASRRRERRPADEIDYSDAAEYQQTEFGPLSKIDDSSTRAYRLNRREGYSPTEGDKPRFAGALATALDLPESQMKEVYSIMGELDLSAFGSQRRLELVALGVITVVVNYDRFQRQQNPDATRISETSDFQELMIQFEIDYSDLGTVKRVVKQELKDMGYFDAGSH